MPYTDWIEQRRNLFTNPMGDAATGITGFSAANGATVAYDAPSRSVRLTTPISAIVDSGANLTGPIEYTPGVDTYTVSMVLTGVVADGWRISVQGTWGYASSAAVVVGAGETKRVSFTFTTTAGVRGALYLLRQTASVAGQVLIDDILFEKGTQNLPFFDGSTPNSANGLTQSVWLGAVNGSSSSLQVRRTIPVTPVRDVATDEALYGDRVTSYRWEVLAHPRVRRNLALNPWPVNGGALADYYIRWGFTRSFTGSEVVFTCTSTQDSSGRGFDIRGNLDVVPPGTTGDAVSLKVRKGDTISISALVASNKAASMYMAVRQHDGNGNWRTGANGPTVAVSANTYTRIGAGYTATEDGYLMASVRMLGGVTLVAGDTIMAKQLVIEPGTLTFDGYFDGASNDACRYTGAPNASTSYMVPTQDVLVGMLDGVSDGSLTWVNNAAVKGGGKATVVDLEVADGGKLRIADIPLESVRIRPVCIIQGLPENPLGVFLVSAAEEQWEATGRVWSVELLDRCTVPSQDAVDESYSLPAGTLIFRAVLDLLVSSGEYMAIDKSSTLATSSGMAWEAGTSKLKIINDLLDVAGYNSLWMDGYGNYQMTPRVLPANRPLQYEVLGIPRELRDGNQSIYQPDWTRSRDSFEVPNKVIAVQAAGGGDTAALVGSWTNEDSTSPYSYQTRGRWIPYVLDSVECPAGTPDQIVAFLQNRARSTLVQMSAVQAQVKVNHLPIPARVSDVLRFSHSKAGIDTRHVITRIQLDTSPLGLMSSTLQEVVSL